MFHKYPIVSIYLVVALCPIPVLASNLNAADVPLGDRPQLFVPAMDEAATDPHRFAARLNEENLLDAQTVFADLQNCRSALAESGANDKGEALAGDLRAWQSRAYRIDGHGEIPLEKVLKTLELSETLPIAATAAMAFQLQKLHDKYLPDCAAVEAYRVGSQRADEFFSKLEKQMQSATLIAGIRTTLRAAGYIGNSALSALTKLVPDSMIQSPQTAEFIVNLFSNAFVQERVLGATALATEDLRRMLRVSFSLLRPYTIPFEGSPDSHQTYPFVAFFAQPENRYGSESIRECVADFAQDPISISELSFREKTSIEFYQNWLAILAKRCPKLSRLEIISLTVVGDRPANRILPVTARMFMISKYGAADYGADDDVIPTRGAEEEQMLFSEFAPWERFTALHREGAMARHISDVAVPHFARCHLSAKVPKDVKAWHDVIFILGLGYRMMDAHAEVKVLGANPSHAFTGAIAALQMWDKSSTLPCK